VYSRRSACTTIALWADHVVRFGFPHLPVIGFVDGGFSSRKVSGVELLTAFVGVCHAVAYVHSRGIIHRDLKGQNVVLGDFGEVMVLNWGLAKRVGPDQ
jgi:serine/threonine protein kinase